MTLKARLRVLVMEAIKKTRKKVYRKRAGGPMLPPRKSTDKKNAGSKFRRKNYRLARNAQMAIYRRRKKAK